MKTFRWVLVCLMCAWAGLSTAWSGEYQNNKIQPDKALLLQLQREQWQALAAVCATPAFYGNGANIPLIFDDGSGKNEVVIPHGTHSVRDWGADAAAVTAHIATQYWRKAEIVFVVDTYEHALWAAPCAALQSAPMLVHPTAATLAALGVKEIVFVNGGEDSFAFSGKTIALPGKVDVWKYQLGLLAAAGQGCDYVVVTNPHDTDDTLNPNVQWPYLSLAAAPLAVYRHALVQTDDYTGDRKRLHALGGSSGDSSDKAKLQYVKPSFQKVKDACNAAEQFLIDHGQKPLYLGMVGGSVELPYYICDLHAKYKYWDIQIDYVPADTPYATLRNDVDFTRFVKPDLSVGRIMADNVLDATYQLARTFFRNQFLPGGKYASLAPAGWEKKAIVFDGHRLNQPDEGGPDASPNESFHPAGEVKSNFDRFGLQSEYVVPRNETQADATGVPAPELFGKTSSGYGFVQYVAHGDPPYMRIEAGRSGKDIKNYLATGAEFRKQLHFQAPTVAYVIGCNVGTVNASFKSNEEFLPTSAIHAGAVAFMAPNKCQAICFWRYAPKGPGADQCILFWENALAKKMPIGPALIDAKWRAYQMWRDQQAAADRGKDSDNVIEIDAPAMVLFGDPALKLVE